ncbi:MAG: hypothetical protein JWQ79_2105 [Mucilaginibacter sp.]|nr:hypothetical protein [Mucilaginibacter sp.]
MVMITLRYRKCHTLAQVCSEAITGCTCAGTNCPKLSHPVPLFKTWAVQDRPAITYRLMTSIRR